MSRTAAALARALAPGLLVATLLNAPPAARADEGMWTFDNLPLRQIQERYGFTPTPAWLEHVQKASVNFGGASGAFVSAEGLVLTNHHVGLGQLQKVSTEKADYVRDGFYARTRAEELPCPDLELRVLLSVEDVTARVNAAIDARAPESLQNEQRKAAMARIEKAGTDRTKQQCRVVELYHGGEYWLYCYHKYTDVRLVMAPEQQTAFYGGDPDNFCYPRHDLDMTFFRVYENGQPVHPTDYFKWSAAGPKDVDLVFTSGNPGSTSRLRTVSELEYERDYEIPMQIRIRERQLETYRKYSLLGPEQARRATDRIFGIENGLKRLNGFREAMADGRMLRDKRTAEDALRARVAGNPKLTAECGGSWDRIAAAQKEMIRRHREYLLRKGYLTGRMVGMAGDIVRYVAETARPNEKRLSEFRDNNLESFRFQLFSRAPLYPDLQEIMLTLALEECRRELGPDDAFVKAALAGGDPAQVAHQLITGTRIADVAFRRELVKGGAKAVAGSTDPLIQWARRIDPAYRELRKWYEDNVESIESLEGGKIARARFELDGKSVYPDATGTLRLSFGKVAGYPQLTTLVPWKTTFFGLYDRALSFDDRFPFTLPERIAAHRADVDLATPLNFVSTNDIVGGNSGSPVLNRDAEYVGLVFDGNVQAFAWDYAFDETQGRTVSVHSAAILEALRKIYGMGYLADELVRR
jgi:hypothetical protein